LLPTPVVGDVRPGPVVATLVADGTVFDPLPGLLEPQALTTNAISTDTARMTGTRRHPVRARTSFTALRLLRGII
jgi:hypothetical protein